MGCLLELLDRYCIGGADQHDEMVWCLEEENGFIVKSMCKVLGTSTSVSFPRKCVWNLNMQLRDSFLMWELWWNMILTLDNLRSGGMYLPSWCCLCKGEGESAAYIFLHCSWTVPIWSHFINRFGVAFITWTRLGREMWLLVPAATCGAIWDECNMRSFEGIEREVHKVLDCIFAKIYGWFFLA